MCASVCACAFFCQPRSESLQLPLQDGSSVRGRCYSCPRCLAASNSRIAAAAETFRDPTFPRTGIETSRSQLSATRGRSPFPSLPSTSTTFPVKSVLPYGAGAPLASDRRDPHGTTLGDHHAGGASGLGGAAQGTQVARILDLVQRDDQSVWRLEQESRLCVGVRV